MDELTCAKELANPINLLGGKFMMDPATFATASDVGMEPSAAYYVVGRFGLLGSIPDAEAADLALFVEPTMFKQSWGEVSDHVKVGERYLQCAADWGRANLKGVEGVREFANIAQKLVEAQDSVPHSPLYMALRNAELPTDDEGKAAQLAHALRELRFSHHTKALKAEGMEPVEAILIKAGPDMARMFQWQEPYKEVTDEMRTRHAKIEEQTDALAAEDCAKISAEQRQGLVDATNKIISTLEN